MLRKLLFLLVGFEIILLFPCYAQHLVRGTVMDATTGEPLPAANILIEGTLQGTITNEEGRFALRLEELPTTLIFRYIGYSTQRLTIPEAVTRPLEIRLQPVAYELGELVVTGEDPAIAIMRRVIEQKQQWRSTLQTFQAEAYTRFTLANDTGIVSIIESLSEVFWDDERGMKEIVKSKRQTANVPFDEFLPAALFVSNLYDDNIEIAGYEFIGVTHPKALDHYDFRLTGTRQLDDRIVYDITVEPQSRLATAFKGRVAVLDSAWALLEVALQPGEAFLFPPPIRQFDVIYFQQFSDFGRAYWLPVDFRSETELTVSFQGLLSFPTFHVRQVSRLTNYEINVPLPDTLFEKDQYLAVDSVAVEADTLLDREGVSVPLETRELEAYETIDSTDTLEEAYKPSGPLARLVRIQRESEEENERRSRNGFISRLGIDLEPELWFNRVEGFHAGLSIARSFGPLRIHTGGGWSAELEDEDQWSRSAGTELFFGPGRRAKLGIAYDAGPEPRYDSRLYSRPIASVYLLLGGKDYFDYYWRRRFMAEVSYRVRPLDASLTASYINEHPRELQTHTGYDFVGQDRTPRPNPPVQPLDFSSGILTLAIGQDEPTLGITGRRLVVLEGEIGAVNYTAGPEYFSRLGVEVDWYTPTLFRRRLLPAMLYVHVTAGVSSGSLPIQRNGIIEARLGPYSPFGALRTLTGRPYEGDHHLGILWEHNFRTVPFEVVGLYNLAKRGYNIILHGGHARTWLSEDGAFPFGYVPFTSGVFHHEIGVSLSGLFGLFRLDLTGRLDEPAFTVGFGVARLF